MTSDRKRVFISYTHEDEEHVKLIFDIVRTVYDVTCGSGDFSHREAHITVTSLGANPLIRDDEWRRGMELKDAVASSVTLAEQDDRWIGLAPDRLEVVTEREHRNDSWERYEGRDEIRKEAGAQASACASCQT